MIDKFSFSKILNELELYFIFIYTPPASRIADGNPNFKIYSLFLELTRIKIFFIVFFFAKFEFGFLKLTNHSRKSTFACFEPKKKSPKFCFYFDFYGEKKFEFLFVKFSIMYKNYYL